MAAHRLVADFPDADVARSAVISLERHGVVDAEAVDILGADDPRAEETRRAADRQVGRSVLHRAAVGGLIGALAGAALGLAIALAGGTDSTVVLVATTLGAAAFAGAIGAYWSVGSGLPVTDGALEARGDGPVRVVIDLTDAPDDRVRALLDEHGAVVRQ